MGAKKTTYPGIPPALTLEKAEAWVRPRISEKRFRHVVGVVEVSRKIAKKLGADEFIAQLAGWLHDACKEVKDVELVRMADEFGMKLDPIERRYGHLLHGPVAAQVAKRELGVESKVVLDAISEHTLGAIDMTDQSMICFLADCLEESRPEEYTAPIWQALSLKGIPNPEAAILIASDLNLEHLLQSKRPIHPRTVEVRNYYLDLVSTRATRD